MSAVAFAFATTLAGCSSSSNELRTPAQSAGFVAEVVSGEPDGQWSLANDPSQQAIQAWAARARISDLGRMLRSEAHLPSHASPGEATWTCEMARKLVSLGAVGSVTSFNSEDAELVTKETLQYGVKPARIAAMIHDASTVPFRDFALATVAVCGPPVS